jgi:hypothetical protein
VRADRLSEDVMEALLEPWPVAHLATLDGSGRPRLVPVVFAAVGGVIWTPVDGKPKRGGELARVRNVRARPAVSGSGGHRTRSGSARCYAPLP